MPKKSRKANGKGIATTELSHVTLYRLVVEFLGRLAFVFAASSSGGPSSPFLNSVTLCPRDRITEGSRLPKSSKATKPQ